MIETDLSQLQQDVGEWAEEQFGAEQPTSFPVIGAGEELGELTCSVLKRAQGIDDSEKYSQRDDVGPGAEKDAVGDVVIYLCDAAYRTGRVDLGDGFEQAIDRYPSSIDNVIDMIRMLYSDYGEVSSSRLEPISDETMKAHAEVYEWAEGPPDEMEMLEERMGKVIVDLIRFCELREYDFDRCVMEAADEVLDREWRDDVEIDEAYRNA